MSWRYLGIIIVVIILVMQFAIAHFQSLFSYSINYSVTTPVDVLKVH